MKLKTALVHEWFVNYAGSEKVLEQILTRFPEADIYSQVDFLPSGERDFILNKSVTTSFIQHLPMAKKKYRNYLPLMPLAVQRFDLSDYDLIISNSHCVAKGVRKRSGQLHISYCYTPMRYVWDLRDQYLKESGLDKGMKGFMINKIFDRIKQWDIGTVKGVDHFITLSHYIQRRIRKAYGRDSTVIYPPVDIEKFSVHHKKDEYYLTVSRMVPYKKIDLIVEAFSETGLPLVVIGDGPDYEKIKNRAKKNVEFLGFQEDDVMKEYMQKAKAFVFAAEEDFGIVPVEAQACGTPVIAFGRGGVTETVIPFVNNENIRPTGIFFNEQTVASLIDAINVFLKLEGKFNPSEIRKNAELFSIERFRKEFTEFVDKKIEGFFG